MIGMEKHLRMMTFFKELMMTSQKLLNHTKQYHQLSMEQRHGQMCGTHRVFISLNGIQ